MLHHLLKKFKPNLEQSFLTILQVRDGIMQTRLMIYDVKPVHFSMIYEVMYDKHVVETMLYEIGRLNENVLSHLGRI